MQSTRRGGQDRLKTRKPNRKGASCVGVTDIRRIPGSQERKKERKLPSSDGHGASFLETVRGRVRFLSKAQLTFGRIGNIGLKFTEAKFAT